MHLLYASQVKTQRALNDYRKSEYPHYKVQLHSSCLGCRLQIAAVRAATVLQGCKSSKHLVQGLSH
jgi:hypothetical protein